MAGNTVKEKIAAGAKIIDVRKGLGIAVGGITLDCSVLGPHSPTHQSKVREQQSGRGQR